MVRDEECTHKPLKESVIAKRMAIASCVMCGVWVVWCMFEGLAHQEYSPPPVSRV